ncbi:MAG: DUF1257 domain-containing protein [Cyanobacteria bacterium]|nr:DUF1257 domain-containing protein [Cyanobacteriota bacterium]
MSHLSILPTLLRDVDLLAAALTDLGQAVQRGGVVEGFAGERVPVLLRLDLIASPPVAIQTKVRRKGPSPKQDRSQPLPFSLGWARQLDGSLALVGDLGRLAAASPLQELLSQLSRRYALRQALKDAAGSDFASAEVSVDQELDANVAEVGSSAPKPVLATAGALPLPRS